MEPSGEKKGIGVIPGAMIIVIATFVAYIPVMDGGWLWDDDVHVTKNTALRDLDGLKRLWFSVGVTPQYYPLTHTSFWIQYQLWGAESTLPYQIVNILLHLGTSFLLWWILDRLGLKFAWLAAAIFALHPVHVESVGWVTERKNTLSGFFYMLGAMCFLRSMEQERMDWRWYGWGALAFVAALFSKTVTASLPAAVLLMMFWKQGGRLKRVQILSMIPLLLIGAGMGQVTAYMEKYHVGAEGPEFDYTFLQRFRIAGTAAWFYVMKLFIPIRQSFIYWRWDVRSWGAEMYVFPAAMAGVLVALLALRKRIGWGPLVAVLFFGGTVFPALGFVNLYPTRYTFVADHFQYLASIGIIILMAAGLWKFPKVCVAVLLVLAGLTWVRAGDFRNEEVLWEDTLAKNPRAWIAHDQLGSMALERGEARVRMGQGVWAADDFRRALDHYSKAVAIDRHVEGFMGMSNAYRFLGNPADAIQSMQEAVKIAPDRGITHFSLAGTLRALGQFEEALRAYDEAIRVEPDFAPAYMEQALLYDFLGRTDLAAARRAEGERLARGWVGTASGPTTR